MVTVYRAHGFRFVIFSTDHEPAHLHVFRQSGGHGGEAKVNLAGPDGVSLEWVVGIDRADMRRILLEIQAQREMLLEAWRRIHG
jgi:hypothetical protein